MSSPEPYPRRWLLLAICCIAQFADIYAASGTVLAIPHISERLGLTVPESIWVISAYSLSFAAMMLSAGRLADIWSAKYVFILGLVWVGSFSIGLAVIRDANGLIVLRALQGVGAAMTIPAATNLIVNLFPEPNLQEIAIAIFGSTGALANVLGLVIGGLLLLADYKWIFYFTSMLTFPMAILAFLMAPANAVPKHAVAETESGTPTIPARKPKMDYLGTITMTAAIVLFIYGLTSANIKGWKSAESLSTMIIGFCLFGVFYFVETLPKDEDQALIPPSMWRIPNFALLAVFALGIQFWFFAVQSSLSEHMQQLGVAPLLVAARFVPIGISVLFTVGCWQNIPLKVVSIRYRLLIGGLLAGGGTLLISFAKETASYWRLMFPGFIIGASGVGLLYLTLNIGIVMSVRPDQSGVAGGVLNSIFQLGITIGLAITTVIQNSYRNELGRIEWKGYHYSFFFVMAVEFAIAVLGVILYRTVTPIDSEPSGAIEKPTTV